MKALIWETHDQHAYRTTPAELLADNHGDEAVSDAVAYLKGEANKRGFDWAGVCFGGGAAGLTFITVRRAGVVLPHEDEMADCCLHESLVPRRAPLRTIKRRTPNAMDEIHRKAEAAFAESDRQMQERADAAARSEAEARRAQAEAQRRQAEAEAARKQTEAAAAAAAIERARAQGRADGQTATLQRHSPIWTPDEQTLAEIAYESAFKQGYNTPEAQRRRAEAERQRQEAERQRQQQQQQQQSQQRPPLKERKALFVPNPPSFADHRRSNPTASRFVLLDAGPSAGHHGADDRYTLICTTPQGSGSRAYYNYLGFGTGVSGHGEFTASEFRELKAERYRSLGKSIKIEALPANMRRLAESFIADCG